MTANLKQQGPKGLRCYDRVRFLQAFRNCWLTALASFALAGCGQSKDAPALPGPSAQELSKAAKSERPLGPAVVQSGQGATQDSLRLYELKMPPKNLAALEFTAYS